MVGYEPEDYETCRTAGCLDSLMTEPDDIFLMWAIAVAEEGHTSLADAMIDFRIFEQPHYVPLPKPIKPLFHEPIRRRGNATCVYK